eukprot:m.333840 g.333840  ORF g.333840 m.333840 type:complete len:511 (-) comp17230_c0_seq1:4644-6176(-)
MEAPTVTTIVVFGASGDLAKKKIYPVLWSLFKNKRFSDNVRLIGYARSKLTNKDLSDRIAPFLKREADDEDMFERFLGSLLYFAGDYEKPDGYEGLNRYIADQEKLVGFNQSHRVFYLALPPSVFQPVTERIRNLVWAGDGGSNKVIVEKPFGRDAATSAVLSEHLGKLFQEPEIYRIDHYLGKEMVQNMFQLRFANRMFTECWNKSSISNVQITFKENFGTKGRGGYFDEFGIIRDILQNHLLQVLCFVAMERPKSTSSEDVRDAKVEVLKRIDPISVEDVVLGQYVGRETPLEQDPDSTKGYLDDEGVPKDSVTPTFCTCAIKIHNDRWEGVPFIMKAGKALNERKAEIRIQFKQPGHNLFPDSVRNELVVRIQPNEAIWMKVNAKNPGMSYTSVPTFLDLTYGDRFEHFKSIEAYERLILDVFNGNQANFVRSDELKEAWRIFTPLLHKIEGDKVKPIPYVYGSRGPKESDEFAANLGYEHVAEDADSRWFTRSPVSSGRTSPTHTK